MEFNIRRNTLRYSAPSGCNIGVNVLQNYIQAVFSGGGTVAVV
jgi:hypothetical protein